MNFTPATDDENYDAHSAKELAMAIRAVEPGHATIITLHRADGRTTRYIFNWRHYQRPPIKRRPIKSERETQDDYLARVARKAERLPKECFQ